MTDRLTRCDSKTRVVDVSTRFCSDRWINFWTYRCTDTAESLAREAQLSGDYQVCDNIDLDTVLVEFSDYYYAKYNKYPKICKKVEGVGHNNVVHNPWVTKTIIFHYIINVILIAPMCDVFGSSKWYILMRSKTRSVLKILMISSR